jgi:dUTP pyrophosphatase
MERDAQVNPFPARRNVTRAEKASPYPDGNETPHERLPHGCVEMGRERAVSDQASIDVQVLPEAEGLDLPEYASPGSAGMDLRAAVADELTLQPGQIRLVTTGLRLAIPPGYEAQIRPRSGLALKHGITIPNAPGTIDSDYRGVLQVILANTGPEPFTVSRGDRIAQMVIAPVTQAALNSVPDLDDTERGEGGFGSSGTE